MQKVELVGPTNANVLILGESGSGKELIAKAIHACSQRSDKPLVRVNCSAIPKDLFESEFFGHVKGAFTGAFRDREGRFEQADGGTLLLDEIGDIPLELQSKLLRVLQESEFERVGEGTSRKVDVRVISATHRDLEREVRANRFRQDLYFRLNVVPLTIPPLRERLEDIPRLMVHFLQCASEKHQRPQFLIGARQIDQLKTHTWPGNIRELENVIERAIILSSHGKLKFDLPCETSKLINGEIVCEEQRKQQESENIIAALERTDGKIYGPKGAANLLGIKPTTLASRLKALGISKYRQVLSDSTAFDSLETIPFTFKNNHL